MVVICGLREFCCVSDTRVPVYSWATPQPGLSYLDWQNYWRACQTRRTRKGCLIQTLTLWQNVDSLNETQKIEKKCWNRQDREFSGQENQGRVKREEIQEDKWIHSHLDYSYWDHLSTFSGHWFWLRQLRNGKWRNGGYSRSFALQWLTDSSEHSWDVMGYRSNGKELVLRQLIQGLPYVWEFKADTHQRQQMEPKFHPKDRRLWDCDQSLHHKNEFLDKTKAQQTRIGPLRRLLVFSTQCEQQNPLTPWTACVEVTSTGTCARWVWRHNPSLHW